jgi:hypothetical protein
VTQKVIHLNLHSLNNLFHEWAHICQNIDNEQNVKTNIKTFLWFEKKTFYYLFELPKKKIIYVIFLLVNNIVNIVTLLICLQQLLVQNNKFVDETPKLVKLW